MNVEKSTLLVALLGGLLLALVSCGATPGLNGTPPVPGGEVGGYSDLVDALRGAGATVELIDEVEQPFFPVTGQLIEVNGHDVQVFEFDSAADRERVSATISETGDIIGSSIPSWIDQPHFWAEGRLIVLFVGQDEALIDLLTGVLGEPITEPGPAASLPPEALLRGQERLAEALGVTVAQIEILDMEQVEWPNACLGLAEPGEVCAEVITPGWRATVAVNGQTYELRTDETGDVVRWRVAP